MERIQQMKYQRKYKISRTAADVLLVVMDFMKASRNTEHKDAYGYYVYASRKTIAKEIGKCVKTVNRAVSELVKAGILFVRKGIRNSHTYFTDSFQSDCYDQKNILSQKRQMSSRIKGITKNNSNHSNLSICKFETDTVISSDDFIREERKKAAVDDKQRRREVRKQAKAEKEEKYKRLIKYFTEKFNLNEETDTDNFFTLKHFAEVLAAKIAYADSINVFGRSVPTDEYYKHIQDCESSDMLEADARTEQQNIRTHAIRNTDNYTLAVLFNMI